MAVWQCHISLPATLQSKPEHAGDKLDLIDAIACKNKQTGGKHHWFDAIEVTTKNRYTCLLNYLLYYLVKTKNPFNFVIYRYLLYNKMGTFRFGKTKFMGNVITIFGIHKQKIINFIVYINNNLQIDGAVINDF